MAKLVVGENDLGTLFPHLVKEWDYDSNGGKTPSDFTAHSLQEINWVGKCGHKWPATIASRTRGSSCPYCSNREILVGFNDLASLYPDIITEWDYENNELSPSDYLPGSHKKAFWICKDCGHRWLAEIRSRTRLNEGCSNCARGKMGDTFRKNRILEGHLSFQEEYPELAAEWDYEKNAPIIPSEILSGTNKKYFWICKSCKYSWSASVNNRTNNKTGCPACAGNVLIQSVNDLESVNPSVAAEWHPLLNGNLTPKMVSYTSNDKVWWKCGYGHEYFCRVADRTLKNVGCKECSKRLQKSLPEHAVFYYVSECFTEVEANYRPSFLKGKELDIYIPKCRVAIEYDGAVYHKDIGRDFEKDKICEDNKITLIRIREKKCPPISRIHPTILLEDDSKKELSRAIREVLLVLGQENHDVDVERDIFEIKKAYYDTAIKGSISEIYPELSSEWNYEKNQGLLPQNILATGSKEHYYWKCKKCGYEWSAALYERINGTGCPLCKNKVVLAGVNDLATTHPEIAAEWNYEKNAPLLPTQVTKAYPNSVWWKCSKCNYEWHVRVKNRVYYGSGCKNCFRRERSAKQKKEVYQYDLEWKFLCKYDSAKDAGEKLGISRSSIQHVCAKMPGYSQAGGFKWSYEYLGGCDGSD